MKKSFAKLLVCLGLITHISSKFYMRLFPFYFKCFSIMQTNNSLVIFSVKIWILVFQPLLIPVQAFTLIPYLLYIILCLLLYNCKLYPVQNLTIYNKNYLKPKFYLNFFLLFSQFSSQFLSEYHNNLINSHNFII